jgi:hypothetical protein
MKKNIIILATVFFMAVTPAIAGAGRGYHHYHGHRGHYGGYYGDVWAAVGIGLLTGVVLSAIVAPPRTVVYPSAAPAAIPAYGYRNASASSGTVTVTVGALNLRSGPGLSQTVIGRLWQGEILTVLGGSPGWLNVRTPAGGVGWVMSRYTAGAVG